MSDKVGILLRFGARLRVLRKERELSQERFAEICDLDRTYISGIERGERNVSLKNIEVLARGLNLELSELFKNLDQ